MKTFFPGRFATLIGTVAFMFAVLQLVDPSPVRAWWDVYHGGYGHDYGAGVAIDGEGSVIVVGYRATEPPPAAGDTYHGEGLNAYLRKYDKLGNFVCDREVKGPGTPPYPQQRESQDSFSDVAVDSDGNYIVSGTISGDYDANGGYYAAPYLNKFDSSCAPVWAAPVIYKYPGDSAWQSTFSVALDANDNIYPTGSVFAGWGVYEGAWATWKYDTNGVLQTGFPIVYNYSPSYAYTDYSQDVAIDSLGNIIVVGYIGQASGNLNWHVRKYDASRTLLWTDTFAGAAGLVDNAYRVVVDSQDNPIVVGYTNKGTSSSANNDWMAIKYAANGVAGQGQRLWTQTYESAPGKDEACYSVAVDEHDNIFVGGIERIDSATFTGVLASLDGATGNLLYVMDLPGPANIVPTRLAYRDGSIAVGGYVSGSPAPNYNDLYVALLDVRPPETSASPAGGFTRTARTVTLSTVDNEPATIYYTTNGATPTTASRKYLGPISIASDTTLKFFGVDTAGNVEEVKTETYVFDTAPPKNGMLTIKPASEALKFDLSWTAFDDGSGSGVKEYWLVVGNWGYLACTVTGPARIPMGAETKYTTAPLTLGRTYYYRVCASDNVGNVSTGATAAKKVLTEYDPPTGGSVIIHGSQGDAYTRTGAVTLELFASGATQMCVSNGNTCAGWVSYATTKTWALTAGSGTKTVKVWFRDNVGNVSEPTSDTIYRDTIPPVNGTLTIVPGADATTFDLSWSEFDDGLNGSGVSEYWLVVGNWDYPACTVTGAARIHMGTERTHSHAGLTLGRTYYYRVCASDNVGNVSTGATASKKVLPEYDPPTGGSVVINGKDTYVNGADTFTRYAAVTLTIAATDATQMCVSNGNTCAGWVAYATTKTWALTAGSGTKTVKVWFRDSLGNVSEPSSDSISLDVAKPVNGTVSIAMGEVDLTFDLSWTAFDDGSGSGVKEYWLVVGTLGFPACTATGPARIYTGTGTTYKHEGLAFGRTYYYRVCASDNVGNVSTGATASRKMQ